MSAVGVAAPPLAGAPGAAELAAEIRAGRLTSVAAVEAHLARIREVNPAVNALVLVDEDGALDAARAADRALARGEAPGPLHGVPFTVKDALETAGLPSTCGIGRLRRHRPERDAPAVARLRAGGAVLLGKTNVPAFTSDYQTDNALFGRTVNPWDPERSPGGSSGGGAAAVAAGLTPLDVGSDVGGSIRLPAHYCGVYGFKPSSRRIPMTGHIPPLPGHRRTLRHLASIGFLARAAADLRPALALAGGTDEHDRTVPPVPLGPSRPLDPAELRLAYTPDFPGFPLAAEVRDAMEALVEALRARGATVRRVALGAGEARRACEDYGALFGAEICAGRPEAEDDAAALRRLRDAESPEPYALGYARGFEATLAEYVALLQRRDDWIARVETVLEGHHAWLVPPAPTVAPPHAARGAPLEVDGREWPYLAQGWHSFLFNLTDHPVATVPAGTAPSGLPCGVQVAGRLWDDAALLDAVEAIAAVAGPPGVAPGA